MAYQMKDLGYTRTPTSAVFRVEMEDGSKWDVPVQAIVDSRDEYYRDDQEDTVAMVRKSLETYEIHDWAGNNMNWDEVEAFAVPAPVRVFKKPDYQEGWCNGEKEIIGDV